MSKSIFQKYILIWLILLIVFNIICFVIPTDISGESRLSSAFWTGYIFITIAFIGNLACVWYALKNESLTKLFYNIPLLYISYIGLILILIISSLFMLVSSLPIWLGIILCFLVLAFTTIAFIKADTFAKIVQSTEAGIKTNTAAMRMLIVEAENLIDQAQSEEIRAECQKVYEAFRYSDPMSNPTLSDIEEKLSLKMNEFSSNVRVNDLEKTKASSENLLLLLADRNRKCKLLK